MQKWQHNISKSIKQKRIVTTTDGIFPRYISLFNIQKSIDISNHINRVKNEKKNMIIPIDIEKAFDKI